MNRLIGLLVAGLLVIYDVAWSATQHTGVREVTVTDRSLVPITTRLRVSTLIVLPDDEDIMDVDCGDKDFWIVEAAQNVVRVKPAKESASTNLNVRTTSGRIYSFTLSEGKAPPDFKVFVVGDGRQARGAPRFYPSAQVDALHAELAQARAASDGERRRADEAISLFRAEYPTHLRFDYDTPPYKKPFYVRALWHDGRFTYLRSDARELPALYEILDGKPSLVNFDVRDGVYLIPKVIERGYLAIGKKRWSFARR